MIEVTIQFDDKNGNINISSNLKPGMTGAAVLNFVLDLAKRANLGEADKPNPGQKPRIVVPQMAIDLKKKQ